MPRPNYMPAPPATLKEGLRDHAYYVPNSTDITKLASWRASLEDFTVAQARKLALPYTMRLTEHGLPNVGGWALAVTINPQTYNPVGIAGIIDRGTDHPDIGAGPRIGQFEPRIRTGFIALMTAKLTGNFSSVAGDPALAQDEADPRLGMLTYSDLAGLNPRTLYADLAIRQDTTVRLDEERVSGGIQAVETRSPVPVEAIYTGALAMTVSVFGLRERQIPPVLRQYAQWPPR